MIKRIFITGLTAVIPLVITIYVIAGLFYLADGIIGKYLNQIFVRYVGWEIPGLGIVIAILIVFLLGVIIRLSRMRFFRFMEKIFFRIPLINRIYFPIRRIVDFLFFPPRKNFKSSVLVEYPRKGIYSVGFVTNDNSVMFKERGERKLYNVFIPSSPSPITGFTIIVEEKELVFLDLSVEEAIRLVVSGGLLNP